MNTSSVVRKVLGVMFLALAFWVFLTTIPWLGTYSLKELPTEYKQAAPPWAKGFSTDHGNLVFHDHGSITEEKNEFFVRIAAGCACLVLFGALFAFPGSRRNQSEAQ